MQHRKQYVADCYQLHYEKIDVKSIREFVIRIEVANGRTEHTHVCHYHIYVRNLSVMITCFTMHRAAKRLTTELII